MTLEQLRIFVAVARLGHMTQAAQQLHLTQSTASAAVAALERRHGVKLFNRVGRGLELSEAGRVFMGEAQAVLARAEAALRSLDELAGLRRGKLSIGASQTIASYWLPPRMAQFAHRYPHIALTLRAGNSQQVAQWVLEGETDIGLVEGQVDDPVLEVTPVDHDRISAYAAPGHPLAAKRRLGLADLTRALWVMREPGSGTRAEFHAAMVEKGVAPENLHALLTLPSNEAVMAAVTAGGTLAAVSDLAAAPHVAAGRLQRLNVDLTQRAFSAIRHRDRLRSQALREFVAGW